MSDPFKVCYLAPASSLNGQTPPAKPTLKSIRTRRNTSLSCSACRLRKTKCLGGPPCGNCVKHKTECRREEDKDGRRQTSLKRKLIELEKDAVFSCGYSRPFATKRMLKSHSCSISFAAMLRMMKFDLRSQVEDSGQYP